MLAVLTYEEKYQFINTKGKAFATFHEYLVSSTSRWRVTKIRFLEIGITVVRWSGLLARVRAFVVARICWYYLAKVARVFLARNLVRASDARGMTNFLRQQLVLSYL